MFSQKLLLDNKKYKHGLLKRKTKAKQKTQNRKKWNTLRQAFCGNKIDKKPLKLQENSPFGPFLQNTRTKTQATKNKNTKKQKKTYQKKHPFAFWQTTPYFCKIFVFYQGTFFQVYKAVFCWKHYKNSVFSETQLSGITDSKTPFRGKTQNGTFATKSAILGFPLCPLKPLFL